MHTAMNIYYCEHTCVVLVWFEFLLVLFSGESALSIVIKKVTEGLQGVEKQEATTEK